MVWRSHLLRRVVVLTSRWEMIAVLYIGNGQAHDAALRANSL